MGSAAHKLKQVRVQYHSNVLVRQLEKQIKDVIRPRVNIFKPRKAAPEAVPTGVFINT